MSTKNENMSEEPLPILIPDNELPSAIAKIDQEIMSLEVDTRKNNDRILDLSLDRVKYVERAVATGNLDDGKYSLQKKISYGNRVADPKKLKEQSKERWALYEDAIKIHAIADAKLLIQKAKDSLEKTIKLGIADKIFGEENVTACSTKTETISWEVKKK